MLTWQLAHSIEVQKKAHKGKFLKKKLLKMLIGDHTMINYHQLGMH